MILLPLRKSEVVSTHVKNDVKQLWKSLSECYAEDSIESSISIIKFQAERLDKFTNIPCSGLLSFDEKQWNENLENVMIFGFFRKPLWILK